VVWLECLGLYGQGTPNDVFWRAQVVVIVASVGGGGVPQAVVGGSWT
jgi:hypothetical protein